MENLLNKNLKNRVCVIAEAGVNHNGSVELAIELVEIAAAAGADIVKFQMFNAEKLVSLTAPKAKYQLQTTAESESQYEMLKKLELTPADYRRLMQHCQQQNIQFLATPFDEENVTRLVNDFGIKLLKLSSGEITNGPLLLHAARTQCNIILSTGMSDLQDVENALAILAFGYLASTESPNAAAFKAAYQAKAGKDILKAKVTLLHCTTQYPTPFDDVNLRAMHTLKDVFDLPVGYSDHTQGIIVPIAAAALGATVIEKHFTLDCNLPGPDHKASLAPAALKAMIAGIREVELALGQTRKDVGYSERENRLVARRSLIAAQPIKKGEVFTEQNLTVKRPGNGISPINYWEYLGKPANKDYQMGELIICQ